MGFQCEIAQPLPPPPKGFVAVGKGKGCPVGLYTQLKWKVVIIVVLLAAAVNTVSTSRIVLDGQKTHQKKNQETNKNKERKKNFRMTLKYCRRVAWQEYTIYCLTADHSIW